MIQYEKIISYSIKIKPSEKLFMLKLKLVSSEEHQDICFDTIVELSAIVELLRDESNTFFDKVNNEIFISWEPTGENDHKYNKFR